MDPLRNPDVVAVGRVARQQRVVTQADFDRFARLSGDDNPIHVDAGFCSRTRFGKTLCHGMMLYGLILCVIKTELVPGSVELEQDLMFPGPVYAGDELTVEAEVMRIDRALGHVEVRSRITRAGGGVGCEGRTTVRADV